MKKYTKIISTNRDRNLPTDRVGVVFYGRVSTQHEAQIQALDAQMMWYRELLEKNLSWEYLGEFVDSGVTGTVAEKRDGFQKMIKYAEENNDKVDLIVTREVCRFARNTVDSLTYVRKLRSMGIEVFFSNDNIWSFDPDGELRLAIMSAMAQEESRKISERVLCGQQTSREKGILYGTGNLLGYKLIRKGQYNSKGEICEENTYDIIKEDADTVKLVYKLYVNENMGAKKIANKLTELKRKNASGNIRWDSSKVMRILHNRTYCGYICYNKSYTVDYLNHKRVVNKDKSTYIYKKGDFPAIVSDEYWMKAQKISEKRCHRLPNGRLQGKPEAKDRWSKTLVCSCGHRFERHYWRTNQNNNEKVYGYNCYNVKHNRKKEYHEKLGLDSKGYCDCPSIPEWKLDYMLKNILTRLWKQPWRTAKKLLGIIEDNYCEEEEKASNENVEIKIIQEQYEQAKKRLDNLLMLKLDGKLSDELFYKNQNALETTIHTLEEQLKTQSIENINTKQQKESIDKKKEKLEVIKQTLKECTDFQQKSIDSRLVEQLVERVVPSDKATVFKFYINLLGEENSDFSTDDYYLYNTLKLGFDEARAYRKSMGKYLRSNQWKDLTVEVYLKI